MTPSIERIPITCTVFHKNALTLYLEQDRDDFWMNLGPVWGRFTNRDRLYGLDANPNDLLFVMVEALPKDSEAPAPIVEGANVLWREREAFEAAERRSAFEKGLNEHAAHCPECGSEFVEHTDKFCSVCGNSLIELHNKRCAACSFSAVDSDNHISYCPMCGLPIVLLQKE